MNLTTITTNTKTMNSREIADLTEKNHADVMRDIRNMLDQLGIVASSFAGYYIAENGKQNPCFALPEDLTLTLVSGYSVQMRHRIVTRWKELEATVAAPVTPAIPATYAEALRLAATQAEEIEKLAIERDHAIKTKAYISDAKTASAMGKASAAVKKVKKLEKKVDELQDEIELLLDASTSYATIAAVQRHVKAAFTPAELVAYCRRTGAEIIRVPDARWGSVNSYPSDAWRNVYGIDISRFS